MAQPFLGSIILIPYNFAPYGYLFCDGRLLSIAQYDALFALIGTTYGGDGQSTFGIPDLRSRVPLHQGSYSGSSYALGQISGTENVTLTVLQLPSHTHAVLAQGDTGTLPSPASNYLAGSAVGQYATTPNGATGPMLTVSGSSQPHSNIQPVLGLNFAMATQGVYPPRS